MASHFFKPSFPDVCIELEEEYYDENILNKIVLFLKKMNLSYNINYPYRGSLVPNYVYNNNINKKVISIMLEINKRIYL